MNYYFVLKGDGGSIPDTPLFIQYMKPEDRPRSGEQVLIKGKTYSITAISPPSNPTDQAVTYYVEPYNANRPYKRIK